MSMSLDVANRKVRSLLNAELGRFGATPAAAAAAPARKFCPGDLVLALVERFDIDPSSDFPAK